MSTESIPAISKEVATALLEKYEKALNTFQEIINQPRIGGSTRFDELMIPAILKALKAIVYKNKEVTVDYQLHTIRGTLEATPEEIIKRYCFNNDRNLFKRLIDYYLKEKPQYSELKEKIDAFYTDIISVKMTEGNFSNASAMTNFGITPAPKPNPVPKNPTNTGSNEEKKPENKEICLTM
jgi:hypothetical protein